MYTKPEDKMWQEQYDRWVNHMKPDEHFGLEFDKTPRPLIQKLGLHITDRKGVKEIKTSDPEYYGLAPWVSDDMAEIALTMKVHKKYTLDSLKKLNPRHSEEELVGLLEKLAEVGVVEYKFENEWAATGERMYQLPPFIVGSGEYVGMRRDMTAKHPEGIMMFDRMAFDTLKGVTQLVPPGGGGMAMHVVPVESAIPAKSHAVDSERLSRWLDKYEVYAALPCVCRMSKEVIDEGAGDDYEDICIAVGEMARYCVETKRGHYINYDQAMILSSFGCKVSWALRGGTEHAASSPAQEPPSAVDLRHASLRLGVQKPLLWFANGPHFANPQHGRLVISEALASGRLKICGFFCGDERHCDGCDDGDGVFDTAPCLIFIVTTVTIVTPWIPSASA